MDTQTAYEIAKIILVLCISFAILGIAIQFIRLLGQMVLGFKDVRTTANHLNGLVENVEQDYKALRNKAFGLLDSFEKLLSVSDILYVLKKIFGFFKKEKKPSKKAE